MNLVQKLISTHLISGTMIAGEEVGIAVDQTLTQDALGTLAYLQFEAMNIGKVKTKQSISYVDHLMLQESCENANDHWYLQTVADKYGILYSKPGNGICHQVHLERFSRPCWTLIGGDSHTVTAGAVGMLAMGAGGLDVAVAMAGGAFYLTYPKVVRINFHGQLPPWSTAKDVILFLLKRFSVRGNTNTVFEYGGPGLKSLTVPERATIANMGAELGITTSVFPSDEVTKDFLYKQDRENNWRELLPDINASYDAVYDLDLSMIVPYVATPHSPGNVREVKEVGGVKIDQVMIGSCTNSSYKDLMTVASMLKGRRVHSDVSFCVVPGSRQVLRMISQNGALDDILASGARLIEPSCNFCVGYGQAPRSNSVSVRTNNRNFKGRSGTLDASVYLVSPETAVATALIGQLTDPRDLGIEYPCIPSPSAFSNDDSLMLIPTGQATVFRASNIGAPPSNTPMPLTLHGRVLIKVGDNITTDHIIPAGEAGKFRSNVSKSSDFVFKNIDANFPVKCRSTVLSGKSPIIIAGDGYGQGSSREHAAMCPMHLGVRVIIAKSFERIHKANLINFGIVPFVFQDAKDYDVIDSEDEFSIADIHTGLLAGRLVIRNSKDGREVVVLHGLTPRQIEIVMAGGLMNFVPRVE
ncbi:MAG TPA: aconitate hydratase [Nitrospirota bacterium]|nr:aconitate hydratase [Nitrospirota bacterium]